jgi:hypothetical protein
MDCLRRVASRKLPCTTYDLREIDNLRVLRAAEMVVAFLPPPDDLAQGEWSPKPAQVLAITEKGRKALRGRIAA